jgi:hypothetical protein
LEVKILESLEKLNNLTWGLRIEKMQERCSPTYWHVFFVNPKNKTWYSVSGEKDLGEALEQAVDIILGFEKNE